MVVISSITATFPRRYHGWLGMPLMSLKTQMTDKGGRNDGPLQKGVKWWNKNPGITKNSVLFFVDVFWKLVFFWDKICFSLNWFVIVAVFDWICPQIDFQFVKFKWFEFWIWSWGCVQRRWVSTRSFSSVETLNQYLIAFRFLAGLIKAKGWECNEIMIWMDPRHQRQHHHCHPQHHH